MRDYVVGNPIREILVLSIGAEVDEWQHGDSGPTFGCWRSAYHWCRTQFLGETCYCRIGSEIEVGSAAARVFRGVVNGAKAITGVVKRLHQLLRVEAGVRVDGNES